MEREPKVGLELGWGDVCLVTLASFFGSYFSVNFYNEQWGVEYVCACVCVSVCFWSREWERDGEAEPLGYRGVGAPAFPVGLTSIRRRIGGQVRQILWKATSQGGKKNSEFNLVQSSEK